MTTLVNCWIDAAAMLFSQALAGEPQLVESVSTPFPSGSFAFAATVGGDQQGSFTVLVDAEVLNAPLMGEGIEQKGSWGELLREIAESAAGDLLVKTGRKCRVEKFSEVPVPDLIAAGSRSFQLKGTERAWTILVQDQVKDVQLAQPPAATALPPAPPPPPPEPPPLSSGADLLLDVELEATLRFGCRELSLGEVLDLGPGDVVQLDRTVRDPVDLVVADKIIARGEVVLVNGNFALRVTEVAVPRKRLESIRCLF